MTQPRTETIELTRGDDFAATVTFDQPVATFALIRFTIRPDWARGEADNAGAVFTVELTPTGAYTAGFEISSAESQELQLDRYVHAIQVTTTSGKRYTTQRGPVLMTPDVTR